MLPDTASSVTDRSLDVSQAEVGFVAGDRPHFSAETAALLPNRLSAAAVAIAITIAAAFVGNLIAGTTDLRRLRVAILLLTFVVALLVRSRRQLSLYELRLLELLLFGSLVFQLSLMMLSRIASFAETNDATSMISVRQQFLMAW